MRATTPDLKRALVDRLLHVWEQYPEQRLGQLLVNIMGDCSLFHVEDEVLALQAERWALKRATSDDGYCECGERLGFGRHDH